MKKVLVILAVLAISGISSAAMLNNPEPFNYPDGTVLFNLKDDIGETTNVAAQHPKIVANLQAAYDAHVAEIKANKRPTAKLERPDGIKPPQKPGGTNRKPKKNASK